MRSGIGLLLALLSLAAAARADVLDVRGPTPDYTEISAAVAAAVDGDVIRVWPGTYASFTVQDRSLTIVRAVESGVASVNGSIRIHSLAVGRDVELSGISGVGGDGAALLIYDCEGSVRIRGGSYTGCAQGPGWPPVFNSPGVRIEHSLDVELLDCTLRGGQSGNGEHGGMGMPGLRSINSRVALFATHVTGTNGSADDDPGAYGYRGGNGVEATGPGSLFAAGCTFIGGHGGSADWDPDLWTGEYGWGGDGGWAHFGDTPAWLRDCTLQPGLGGSSPVPSLQGSPGQPTQGATILPGAARLVRTSWLVDDLSPLTVRCEGEVGDRVWLVESPRPAFSVSDPSSGPLLVEPAPAPLATRWLHLGVIDSSGVLLTELPARDLVPFTHRTPHFQAVFIDPTGAQVLGSSSWSPILDAAW